MTYSPGDLWDSRAKSFGHRSVLDLSLNEYEIEMLTHLQNDIMLPLLDAHIKHGGVALDFGCGVGRFLRQLEFRSNTLLAYDPSPEMVKLAKEEGAVFNDGIIFHTGTPKEFLSNALETHIGAIDFIWCSLVFGCIPDNELAWICADLTRLLHVGGVMFFADHVDEVQRGTDFWRWRAAEEYISLFPDIALQMVGNYRTRGNNIGIFTGKRIR